MNKIYNKILLLCVGMAFLSSCDLEPRLYDVVAADNYFENDEAFISALGSAYTNLYSYMNHGNVFSLAETSSDEACVPHRGPDWEDGGQWLRMHKHDFFDGEGVFGNVWNSAYGGINTCNRLIATFESVSDNPAAPGFIAELKTLRAFYYIQLLDIFGNVPLITSFDVPDGFKPATESRQAIYDFVESELLENAPLLSKDVNGSTYARMHYYVAQAMLSSLYLNAEVYTGTAQNAKAIAAANEVIDANIYSLESNYFANFAINNSASSENIFVIPYDNIFAGGFNLIHMTLHYESQKTFDMREQPWNGYCSIADFYNSFEDDDIRKTGGSARSYGVFLAGPQFSADGERLMDGADSWYEDTDGREVNFNPELNELEPGAHRDGGARLSKYEYEIGSLSSMSNDFALYRYGEVLMNKAEAMYRDDDPSNDMEALDLVNLIRDRASVDAFSELNDDNFLAERGREFCFEAKRRTDLIRFDQWGDAWWAKEASDDFKKLMPIPAAQIALNDQLTQNPGY